MYCLISELFPDTGFVFSTGSVQLDGLKMNMLQRGPWKYGNLSKVIKYWESLSRSQRHMNAYNATTQIFLFLLNCSFSLLLLEFLNHIWWCSRLIGQCCPLCLLSYKRSLTSYMGSYFAKSLLLLQSQISWRRNG